MTKKEETDHTSNWEKWEINEWLGQSTRPTDLSLLS